MQRVGLIVDPADEPKKEQDQEGAKAPSGKKK